VNPVTHYVPRARRTARRQAVLALAYSAYLVAFMAAVLALASFVAPTGAVAAAAFAVAGALAVVGAAVWAVDAASTRRQQVAQVAPMMASQTFSQHRIAG
jgi:hypothetical protein